MSPYQYHIILSNHDTPVFIILFTFFIFSQKLKKRKKIKECGKRALKSIKIPNHMVNITILFSSKQVNQELAPAKDCSNPCFSQLDWTFKITKSRLKIT